jgi:PhzF family phenazine biosynthesis protein
MRAREFAQVDVFSERLGDGNPVAVVLDAEGLSEADMARLAIWTNLSETTFVLPPTQPGADYRLRIFTPAGELPFAGHPTLGSCFAWLAAGGVPRQHTHRSPTQAQAGTRIVQECARGLIALQRDAAVPHQLAFATPALDRRALTEAELTSTLAALNLPREAVLASQRLDNGPVWWALLLDSPDTVLGLQPDAAAVLRLGRHIGLAAVCEAEPPAPAGLIRRASREARAFDASREARASASALTDGPAAAVSAAPTPRIDLEVRALFCTPHQLIEDPVTGSLNGSLAQWLMAEGHMPTRYTAAQGTAIGRAGRVQLWQDGVGESAQVWVGGRLISGVTGQILA